ncbi:MAG: hypothetical protein RBR02_07860 [Desulfuromonadaceae bacterium]|nr:hypothetical protein [Desulfuromonadaceae bacterium]
MPQRYPTAYSCNASNSVCDTATATLSFLGCVIGALLVLCLASGSATAAPFPQDKLPPVLQPWSDWVMHQEEEYNCPLVWDQTQKRECVWPSHLQLQAHTDGATFILRGQLDKKEWIFLPGSARYWPKDVTNGGKNSTVLRHNQRPALLLEAGTFHIKGDIDWERIPDSIPVTPGVGLVELELNGKVIPAPEYTRGQLNLRQAEQRSETAQPGVAFQVYRHLEDGIPQTLTTLIMVRISGTEREIVTAKVLPDGFIPMDIRSKIPARLEDDGRLRLLARAGEHEITITARNSVSPSATQVFTRPASTGPWAEHEVWSVKRRGELRSIAITEAPTLDPAQTDIPPPWRQLPTYLLDADASLQFTEIERGQQTASADRLKVQRQMWLDFNAKGYSVRDTISGTLHTHSRLNSGTELELGRARLNGEEQFITRLSAEGADGIELRQQQLNLQADSRIHPQNIASIPALGWEFNPVALQTELNLPPGWRMLAAFGADSVSNTWMQQWSLLDLFIVLLLSIGFARMWGWKYGVIALLGLALTYQEPNAPRFIWLHLLGAAALLRVAPQGRLQRVVRIYLGGVTLAMVVTLLVFSAQQIRSAVYPQLEIVPGTYQLRSPQAGSVRSDMMLEEAHVAVRSAKMLSTLAAPQMMEDTLPQVALPSYSTALETQTGPGIPTWDWRKVTFDFNTSIAPEKRLKLIFSPPWMTRAGLVAGVLLALYMFGRICMALKPEADGDGAAPSDPTPPSRAQDTTALVAILMAAALTCTGLPTPAHAQKTPDANLKADTNTTMAQSTIPSTEMLEELRRLLTLPPDCAPHCVALQHIQVEISTHSLTIEQQLHSSVLSAVPLAFPLEQLTPTQVDTLSGAQPILMRTSQAQTHPQLWARVESGTTTLRLSAPIPANLNQLEIPLPLRAGKITLEAQGWDTMSPLENSGTTTTISFRRTSTAQTPLLDVVELPLYAEVTRQLDLGVEWHLDTTLRRLSSTGKAGVIAVPLLEGEQIISTGIETRAGHALIELGPETKAVHWKSRLEQQSPIKLQSSAGANFREVWQLRLSPLWHATYSGTPLIHTYQNGHWLAQWHPRTPEHLLLQIERPHGTPGQHITLENASVRHKQGDQRSETTLQLGIRSSIATRHSITLPSAEVKVEQVRHNGREIRIEQNGSQLILPLQGGAQQVEITWSREHSLALLSTTPELNLNAPVVNIDLNLTLPQTRWVLFTGGPLMGPAVLFWGVVLVLGIAALLLGRYAPTPLRWWHWFILGAGLSQAPLPALLLVALWLILLGIRKQHGDTIKHALVFNAIQLGLALFSVCALLALIAAVQQGLLGLPEMQVVGHNSSAWNLNWYQDRSTAVFPTAWAVSVPLLVYRGLMLLWALWLALALLHWLRWGWECFNAGALWHTLPRTAQSPNTKTKVTTTPEKFQRSEKDR